ncbi:hypothetical protein MUK42_14923, partial [Musa troglodytarum]
KTAFHFSFFFFFTPLREGKKDGISKPSIRSRFLSRPRPSIFLFPLLMAAQTLQIPTPSTLFVVCFRREGRCQEDLGSKPLSSLIPCGSIAPSRTHMRRRRRVSPIYSRRRRALCLGTDWTLIMEIPKLKEKLKELAWWISSCGCKEGLFDRLWPSV